MKILKSTFLFLCSLIVPSVVFYLLLDGLSLKLVFFPYLALWGICYSYLDKIILMYLNAREVIDTDEQLLFQYIKNESYKTFEKLPRVYLYSGQKKNCFVLESRNEWTIVIERSLLLGVEKNQLEGLVTYLYLFRRNGKAWFQTKAMGICSLVYHIIYWILKNLFFLREESRLYRVLAIFLISITRPILVPFEFFAKKEFPLFANEDLRSLYLQLEDVDFSFGEYITFHLLPEFNVRTLILNYLESYPVLENCRFRKNEL